MKKILLSLAACALALSVSAQEINVPEPEFVHQYIHVTSPNAFTQLPRETGTFKKHESKFGKIAKIGEAAASVAGAAGGVMLGTAGSAGTAIAGLRTATTAASVGGAASTLGYLAGFEGMDIVFGGCVSSYIVPEKQDLSIIYKDVDNETDPKEIMRIVKFKKGKKDRKIRWMNLSSSLLGTEEASGNGFLQFDAHKYGEQSYLIQVPGYLLEKGEYGIIVGSAEASTQIPVATFSVQ